MFSSDSSVACDTLSQFRRELKTQQA